MNNIEQLIDLLKLSSKIELNENERQIFAEKLILVKEKKLEHILFEELLIHKIEYIFYRHLIDAKCLFGYIDKRRVNVLSECVATLQIKYEEYIREMCEISERLNTSKIKYAFLKGASIIDSIYKIGDIIFRNFGDFDILVSKQDVHSVHEVLIELGFVQGKINNDCEIVPSNRKDKIFWALNSHQEMPYVKKSKLFEHAPNMIVKIDINTTIFEGGRNKLPISTEDVLMHTKINSNNYGKYLVLDYSYEFIALCYHFYKDTQYPSKIKKMQDYLLIGFCDIREYYVKFGRNIDWDKFFGIINKCGISKAIFYVLRLVAILYDETNLKLLLLQYGVELEENNGVEWEKLLLHHIDS